MSLFDSASLVVTPSGYKEDKLYSIKPTDGSGDLVVTRATTATRVNSAGLIEQVPYNFLERSQEFNNATFWGVSECSITANNTTAPDGTLTADKLQFTTDGSFIYQPNSGTNSATGCISVYLKADANTQIYIASNDLANWGTGVQLLCNVTTEWQRFEIGGVASNVNGFKSWVIGTVNPTNGGGGLSARTVYIWGAQLNIGSTAKPYFPTTDRLNVPRLTYQNGGGGCPSLLLEKQSTNVVTYSEQFENADWLKYVATISANTTTSPDGTQNADSLVSDSGQYGVLYKSSQFTAGQNITLSIFAKANTSSTIKLGTTDAGIDYGGVFNLSNGTITSSTGVTASIQSMGNGWYRCIVNRTMAGSANIFVVEQEGSKSVYIWGAQGEQSSYPTSYIPTTSSSATRVADACFKTGISSLIGQTEGTMFVDFYAPSGYDSDNLLFILSDNTELNLMFINRNNGRATFAIVTGGVVQLSYMQSSVLSTGRHKVAFAYKQNDFAIYLDGALIHTDTNGNVPICNKLNLGSYVNNALLYNAGINVNALWKTRLSNTELAQLTTI